MLKKLFQYFKRNNWEMVFFAATVEKYCMIKYKLIINGIKVKTKIIRHNGRKSGHEYYEIYIESKEMEKANRIIHS